MASDEPQSIPVEYVRALWSNLLLWYDNADRKAQVVLVLDGAFLSFVTSSLFVKPDDLDPILDSFTPLVWGLLILMGVALVGSILSALMCLWSRTILPQSLTHALRESKVEPRRAETITADFMYFFQHIDRLDREAFVERLDRFDQADEIRALSVQVHAVAGNVTKKHSWVDASFGCAALTLLSFFAAGATYVLSA